MLTAPTPGRALPGAVAVLASVVVAGVLVTIEDGSSSVAALHSANTRTTTRPLKTAPPTSAAPRAIERAAELDASPDRQTATVRSGRPREAPFCGRSTDGEASRGLRGHGCATPGDRDRSTDRAVPPTDVGAAGLRHGDGPMTSLGSGWGTAWSIAPIDPTACSSSGRSAVIDRALQRAWLCDDGEVTRIVPITSAVSQPDPGEYRVSAKDLEASSTFGGSYTEMTHFVVFARGKYSGARVGFHSVPTTPSGRHVQPLDSVGSADMFGESSGCIRTTPSDAIAVWDSLEIGDAVVVIS